MGRYKKPTGGPEYELEEIDSLLEAVLPTNDKATYKGACDTFASAHNRPNGQAIERLLWGYATRKDEYEPSGKNRVQRSGPLTWAEHHLIDMSKETESKEVEEKRIGPADAAYFAKLFNRSKTEMEGFLERPSFGFKPPRIGQSNE